MALSRVYLLSFVCYSVLHILCCALHPFLLDVFLWKIKVTILYMDYKIQYFLWLWKNTRSCDIILSGWSNEPNREIMHNTWYFMHINTKSQSFDSALLIWLLIGIKSGMCLSVSSCNLDVSSPHWSHLSSVKTSNTPFCFFLVLALFLTAGFRTFFFFFLKYMKEWNFFNQKKCCWMAWWHWLDDLFSSTWFS